jgi:4-hydroxy-4-methyl-2-oxoglutarate aldolase
MRSLPEVLKSFDSISVCQLAEALGASCSVETQLKPIHGHFRIRGPAMTVSCPPNDNLTLHHALHLAGPGDVLVVAGGGGYEAALWGELMSLCAKKKRLEGTIVDGAVRDVVEIEGIGYPVFSRAISPCKAAKQRYGGINIGIHCGSLRVNPGDIIFADGNGIIAVPQMELEEVLSLGLEVFQREAELRKQIECGRTPFEILNLPATDSAADAEEGR